MGEGRQGGVKNTPLTHTTHSLTIPMYAHGPRNSLESLRDRIVEPRETQVGPEEVERMWRGDDRQQ